MSRDRAEYMREYYRKNKERCDENLKRYRENNWDRVLESGRASKARNIEKVRIRNIAYYAAHTEKCAQAKKKWLSNNPNYERIRFQLRRSRIGDDRLSKNIVERLMVLQRGKCPVCRKTIKNDYHIDHIIPLAKGGRNLDYNVQLLHSRCNLRKNAKDPVDFMQQEGFLL